MYDVGGEDQSLIDDVHERRCTAQIKPWSNENCRGLGWGGVTSMITETTANSSKDRNAFLYSNCVISCLSEEVTALDRTEVVLIELLLSFITAGSTYITPQFLLK